LGQRREDPFGLGVVKVGLGLKDIEHAEHARAEEPDEVEPLVWDHVHAELVQTPHDFLLLHSQGLGRVWRDLAVGDDRVESRVQEKPDRAHLLADFLPYP